MHVGFGDGFVIVLIGTASSSRGVEIGFTSPHCLRPLTILLLSLLTSFDVPFPLQ